MTISGLWRGSVLHSHAESQADKDTAIFNKWLSGFPCTLAPSGLVEIAGKLIQLVLWVIAITLFLALEQELVHMVSHLQRECV